MYSGLPILSFYYFNRLIDENKINYLPKIILLQEESIKILTAVFNRDSLFWKDWNGSRKEYFQAVEIEKELLSKKVVSKSKYLKLADFKSSFGKIAISAIYEFNSILRIAIRIPVLWLVVPILLLLKLTKIGNYVYEELAIKRTIIPIHCNEDCKIKTF